MFTPEVVEQLKYYVYRLIDPRNGETFYIGKGKENRVFKHIRGERVTDSEDELSDKLLRIREIRLSGFEVGHVIHRHGMDEKTAFEVEAALIDAYPEATNIVCGHHADDRGVAHANQILARYQAPEITFHHKALMITLNASALEKESVYEAVRYAWKLDPSKARKAECVLALRQGLVVGVFIAHRWMEATPENFQGRPLRENRWGFEGDPAPAEMVQLYLGKRIPNILRKQGAANPIKYGF